MKTIKIVFRIFFLSIICASIDNQAITWNDIKEGCDVAGEIAYDWTVNSIKEAVSGPIIKPTYAAYSQDIYDRSRAGTIDDPETEKIDYEKWNPLIKKYAPIFYLASQELYLPIAVEEYCTGLQTKVVDSTNGATIIPAGFVTMEEIYQLYKQAESVGGSLPYYFDNEPAVKFGSNPALYTDPNKTLRTPAYVVVYENDDALYIQFLLFFGFNGPYMVRQTDTELFNPHEADLEHFTIELNKKTHEPQRFYFSSHGRSEGMWLPANHPDVGYEGTHPIAYIARSGHGTYPRAGIYVRIFGFANDHTNAGTRWEPMLKRIYSNTDPRFNPSTMGWVYHPGSYGKRGVGGAYDQSWFMHSKEGDLGRPYDSVLFCPDGCALKQYWCVCSRMPYAEIPQ